MFIFNGEIRIKKYRCRECKTKLSIPVIMNCYACNTTSHLNVTEAYDVLSKAFWYKPWTWRIV